MRAGGRAASSQPSHAVPVAQAAPAPVTVPSPVQPFVPEAPPTTFSAQNATEIPSARYRSQAYAQVHRDIFDRLCRRTDGLSRRNH